MALAAGERRQGLVRDLLLRQAHRVRGDGRPVLRFQIERRRREDVSVMIHDHEAGAPRPGVELTAIPASLSALTATRSPKPMRITRSSKSRQTVMEFGAEPTGHFHHSLRGLGLDARRRIANRLLGRAYFRRDGGRVEGEEKCAGHSTASGSLPTGADASPSRASSGRRRASAATAGFEVLFILRSGKL